MPLCSQHSHKEHRIGGGGQGRDGAAPPATKHDVVETRWTTVEVVQREAVRQGALTSAWSCSFCSFVLPCSAFSRASTASMAAAPFSNSSWHLFSSCFLRTNQAESVTLYRYNGPTTYCKCSSPLSGMLLDVICGLAWLLHDCSLYRIPTCSSCLKLVFNYQKPLYAKELICPLLSERLCCLRLTSESHVFNFLNDACSTSQCTVFPVTQQISSQ